MSWTYSDRVGAFKYLFQDDDLVVEGEFRSWFD